MKKMLLIASCGLILILIIGATSYSRVRAPRTEIPQLFHDKKCTDSPKNDAKPECAYNNNHVYYETAEIFLRDLKRKVRMFYA